MTFLDRCKCCLGNPVAHLCVLVGGTLIGIQLIHTHAHYTMDVDADSYCRNFARKNPDWKPHTY